MGGLFRT